MFDIDKLVTFDTVSSIMLIKLSLSKGVVDGARVTVEPLVNPEIKLEKEE
jgi:hypothetical protein